MEAITNEYGTLLWLCNCENDGIIYFKVYLDEKGNLIEYSSNGNRFYNYNGNVWDFVMLITGNNSAIKWTIRL